MLPGLTARAFWFLRHGQTDWNARDLAQGQVDLPLNATGRGQAEAAAALLRGRGIATLVSSPLSRARVTAEIVAAALGLDVAFDEDLREVAFGEKEGEPIGEWFGEWIAGRHVLKDGESFAAVGARAAQAINRALERPGPVLVVAHGTVFRSVRAIMGLSSDVRTPNAQPLHCEPGDPWTLRPLTA